MNKMQIAGLGVAVAAFGGAYIFFNSMQGPTPPAPVAAHAAPKLDTDEVLVAANDVPMGVVVGDAALTWQVWPKSAISEQMIAKSADPKAFDEFKGAMTRMAFLRGEPIRRDKLVVAGQGGFMSAILPSGKRAVAIQIDNNGDTSAGGFILPNDRVDVVRVFRDDEATKARGVEVLSSQTILTNVRVLAIGQIIQEDNGKKVAVGVQRDPRALARTSRADRPRPAGERRQRPASLAAQPRRQRRRRANRRLRAANNAAASPSCATARRNKRRDERTRPYESAISQSSIERSDRPLRARRGARSRARIRRRPSRAPATRDSQSSIAITSPGAKSIQLGVGRSMIVDLPEDATEIFVGEPKVANAIVRSARRIYISSLAPGQTTIFALGANGRKIAVLEISVGRDVGELAQAFRRRHTGQRHPR